jgi:uncharacterized protein
MATTKSTKPKASRSKSALSASAPGAAHWSDGFFAGLFERGAKATRDSLRMALWHKENSASFTNFKVAADLKAARAKAAGATGGAAQKPITAAHQGTFWSDGDCYKYMEGLSHLYGALPDGPQRKGIKAELDELVALVASAQDDDGYLNTQIQIPGKERWVIRRHHEDYNLGHLFTAAAVHFTTTGQKSFLQIASRAADCTYNHFALRRRDAGQFGWNPTHIPGLVDLYRATKEPRYLELAAIFLDHRGAERPFIHDPIDRQGPDDQNQMGVEFRKETEAVGHAVTAGYLYQGAVEIFRETGDRTLLDAAKRIWEDIAERKMYLTGAVGALPMGISKRGHNVHEAFGREYELPHRTAYNETCANITFGMFCRSMLLTTGEARYADVMEQVVYNSGISGMSVGGGEFCYANPLRSYAKWHTAEEKVRTMHNFTFDRWQIHTCYCCPPQAFRLAVQLQDWAYYTSKGAVSVALYGSGSFSADVPGAGAFALHQETRYPWDGTVTITVDKAPASEVALNLRIPAWAAGATVTVNGAATTPATKLRPGTFAPLKRRWKRGDVVVLELPMAVRVVRANPRVEACRGQVAVQRGPVVYCVESIDLPKGVELENVAIPSTFSGTATYRKDLLGGVVTIEGTAHARKPAASGLYVTASAAAPTEFALTLIPYYTWNNRGRGDMTVWITEG